MALRLQTLIRQSHWKQLLLGSYATLLGLVFPFICWGSWAEPGHPHRGPHFVFASPPGLHDHGHPHEIDDPADGDPARPAGQARPSTLLLQLLPFLVAAASVLPAPYARQRCRHWQPLAGPQFVPAVPLPPPRMGDIAVPVR